MESSVNVVENMSTIKPAKLPPIINDKLFSFVNCENNSKGGIRVVAKCLLCEGEKEVCGSNSSTGNFLNHLKRHHNDEYEAYKKRKTDEPAQSKFGLEVTEAQKVATNVISNYIINSMKPLSTVQDPNFKIMVQELVKLKKSNVKVPTRDTLDYNIKIMYDDLMKETVGLLEKADFLSLTADAWSSHSKSYLGVTCHWLDEDLERRSRILACRRFKGSQTYYQIASFLLEIMSVYGIKTDKVVCVTTDNGSNFCKAFREFGSQFSDINFNEEDSFEDAIDNNLNNEKDVQCESEDDTETLSRESVQKIFETKDAKPELPPHFRCVSHTLSLVATKDVYKANDKQLYHKVMGKCTKVWNLSSSPENAEIIQDICGGLLTTPVPTRWNSLNDAVNGLLKINDLDKLFEALGVSTLSSNEHEFLKEYAELSQPIAVALDILQGEKEVFLGDVLPALRQVEKRLVQLETKTLQCTSILNAFLEGLRMRFKSMLSIDPKNPSNFVLAAISHPRFKLRWIESEFRDEFRKSFIAEARKFSKSKCENSKISIQTESFYDFEEEDVQEPNCEFELECYMYFNDKSNNLMSLHKYPTVEKMFRFYNTGLPSSAPVEKLFSFGELILSSRRCKLSDDKFEKLILLKCNNTVFS